MSVRRRVAREESGDSVILLRAAGWRFGIYAAEVKEICELDAPPKEKHGGRILRLSEELGLKGGAELRVLMLGGLELGLAVDEVEKMTVVREVLPLPSIFRGREREWYCGLLVVEGLVVPLLNSAAFAWHGAAGGGR